MNGVISNVITYENLKRTNFFFKLLIFLHIFCTTNVFIIKSQIFGTNRTFYFFEPLIPVYFIRIVNQYLKKRMIILLFLLSSDSHARTWMEMLFFNLLWKDYSSPYSNHVLLALILNLLWPGHRIEACHWKIKPSPPPPLPTSPTTPPRSATHP